jgi:hypothetical protein
VDGSAGGSGFTQSSGPVETPVSMAAARAGAPPGGLGAGSGASSDAEVGQAFARRGGLAPGDVASTVHPGGMSVLQTPQDGQLMVVASQSATPLEPDALTRAAVDAQMAGRPAAQGMSDALAQQGYAVYERPWGDFLGKFVRVAPGSVS